MKRQILFPLILAALLAAAAPAACSPQNPSTPPVSEETIATPSETAGLQPTAESAPLAVLLSQPSSDQQLKGEIEAVMQSRLATAGWQVEVRSEIASDETTKDLKLIVALPPYPGVNDLAVANPGKQIIAVGFAGLQAGGNLSVVVGDDQAAAQLGFIAGYTAALMTTDWRVGVISISDTTDGQQNRQGFIAGVRYFCGLCLQNYPPYYQYPLYAEVPSGASNEQLQGAANQLIGQAVETVFLAPGVGNASLHEGLAQAGIVMIGSAGPPEPRPATWAATIYLDLAAATARAIDGYLAGNPSQSYLASIDFQDVDEANLSPGKLEHIRTVIDDLMGGWILPLEAAP